MLNSGGSQYEPGVVADEVARQPMQKQQTAKNSTDDHPRGVVLHVPHTGGQAGGDRK
jgi:hypothetical protein